MKNVSKPSFMFLGVYDNNFLFCFFVVVENSNAFSCCSVNTVDRNGHLWKVIKPCKFIYYLFPFLWFSCKTVGSFGEIQPRANRSMEERTFNLNKNVLGDNLHLCLEDIWTVLSRESRWEKKRGTLLNVASCVGVIRLRCWAFPAFHFSVKQRKARNKT